MGLWLCGYIRRPMALFGCNHLGCITRMLVTPCVPFPFSATYDDTLAMLVCATRWLSSHLHTLAYMFMHESCLLVCHPCFNTIKLWTFDPNLHLSLTDTTFCLFSCCSSAFSFFLCTFLILSPTICYACHVYHVYLFMPLSYSLCTFSFHCLSASFLSLPLHVQTWSEDASSRMAVVSRFRV